MLAVAAAAKLIAEASKVKRLGIMAKLHTTRIGWAALWNLPVRNCFKRFDVHRHRQIWIVHWQRLVSQRRWALRDFQKLLHNQLAICMSFSGGNQVMVNNRRLNLTWPQPYLAVPALVTAAMCQSLRSVTLGDLFTLQCTLRKSGYNVVVHASHMNAEI